MFTFIDLFAGIGGTRLGFEAAGGMCVFSSEYDRFAAYTYAVNHGEVPAGRHYRSSNFVTFPIMMCWSPDFRASRFRSRVSQN